jgi:hypothetical protein
MRSDPPSPTRLERLLLVVTAGAIVRASLERLAIEHPTVDVAFATSGEGIVIDALGWRRGAEFASVDRAVARSSAHAITVCGTAESVPRVAIEVLTRCQRFVDRRNAHSAVPAWDVVARAHRALHDTSKPLVAADLDHAVDTWQWLLRLCPNASLELQLAALFHDVERLESEADRRIEQDAPDYAAFKDRHARRGGERAYELLRQVAIEERIASRVRELVGAHERRGCDEDVDAINDADGLSFFSLNSPGYADYFGALQTRKKVAYTLRRLGMNARRRLAAIRLRDDVREHLVLAGGGAYVALGGAAP